MNIRVLSSGCVALAASLAMGATVDFPGAGGDLATSTAGVGDTIQLVNNGAYSLSEDRSFLSVAFADTVTEIAFDFGSAGRKLTLSPTANWLNMFGTDNAVGSFVRGEINVTTDKNIGVFRSGMKNGTATFGKDFFYNAPSAEFTVSQYGKDNTLTITDGAKLTANIINLANNDVSGVTLNIEKGAQVESKMRIYTGKNGAGGYVGRNKIVVSGANTLLKYSGAYRFCVGFNKKYDGVIVKDNATVDSKIFQLGSGDNGSCAYLEVSNGADFTCTSLEFNGNASTAKVENASFACKDGTKSGTFLFNGKDSAFIVRGADSSLTLPSFGANNAKPLDFFGAGHRQLFSLEDGAKWNCRIYAMATNTSHSVFRVTGAGSTFGSETSPQDFYFGTCVNQWTMPNSWSNRVEILDGAVFNSSRFILGGHANEVIVSNATLNAGNDSVGLRVGYQSDAQAESNRLILRGTTPAVRVTSTTNYRCVFTRGGTLRYEIPAEGYAAGFVPLTCLTDFAMVEGDITAGQVPGKLEIVCDAWADAAKPGTKLTLLRAGKKLSGNFKDYVKNAVAATLPDRVRVTVTDYEVVLKKLGGLLIFLPAYSDNERVSKRFGFDPEDSTQFLQAALDSGMPEIVIDRKDGPWVTRPLFARSNQRIILEKGVTLLAKRGEYRGRNDRLLTVKDCRDVRIFGNGAVLRMWREDYAQGQDGDGNDYLRGEWRHALAINGSQRVTVEGLVLEDSGGDGIYVSEGDSLAKDIDIRNCVCDRNHRQGLSIISGENVLVEKCVFRNTRGAAPEDGVDIEPNDPAGHCVNVVIRDCVSENNAGNGFEAALSQLRASTRPVSIRFEGCRSTGDRYGAKIRTSVDPKTDDYPTGSVVYDHCTFTKTAYEAINVQQVPEQAFEMRFDDCTFGEIGTGAPDAPLVVLYSVYDGDPKPALPKMKNVRWPDRGDRRTYVYDILDPAVLGQETLPIRAVDLSDVRVVDSSPGSFAEFAPVAIRDFARFYVYADRARDVTLAAKQVPVGPVAGEAVSGKVDVVSEDGSKVATLDLPGYDGTTLVFAAPKAGFYTLEFNHGANAIALTGADAPVALDVTARSVRQGRTEPVDAFRANGSFFVPVAAGGRAEIRVQGSRPSERVGFSVIDPAGQVAFADPSVLYATFYQTPASAQDGVWEIRLRTPKAGFAEDSAYELAGVQPLFFLSKDRYWYSK